MTQSRRFCDGIARRDFLRLGTAGLFGMGLALPACWPGQARRRRDGQADPRRLADLSLPARRPEHHRHARPEARRRRPSSAASSSRSRTNVPGIQIGEHLPQLARQMDKFSLIRSFRHHNSDHGAGRPLHADRLLPAGRLQPEPEARTTSGRPTARSSPASSGRAARCRRTSACPRCTPAPARPTSAPRPLPFVIDADPNAPTFAVPDVVPPPALAADRLDDRRKLLRRLDRFQQSRRGAGQPPRPGGRRLPAEGVRPDDLAGRPRRRSTSTPSRTSCATSMAATRWASRA